MARVFVTGGTGVIGRALVERLVERGDDVVALARSAEAESALRAQRLRGGARRGVRRRRDGAPAWTGCALAYNLAGVNTLCVV